MRKIEKAMRDAIEKRKNWCQNNTEVRVNNNEVKVYLHGNLIMRQRGCYNPLEFSLSGWNTPTTRSRLRAMGCRVCCINSTPYRDGKEWWSDF